MNLPLPLREGVGGRGACASDSRAYAPLPPTPSLKGRGRLFSITPASITPVSTTPAFPIPSSFQTP